MTIKIFISYSHIDFKGKGRKLYNYLSKVVPESVVYIDQKNPEGTYYEEENLQNLEKSDIIIAIITPAAINSKEVEKEVKRGQELGKTIIPCKDDHLEMLWKDMPWGLKEPLGIEFDDFEDFLTDVYRAVMRARKKIENMFEVVKKSTHGGKVKAKIPILYANQTKHLDIEIIDGDIAFLDSQLNAETISLDLVFFCIEQSKFSIVLPRNIIDAKKHDRDDSYFVLLNGAEITFEEDKTDENRTITISIPSGDSDISIIGTQIFGVSYTGEVKSENIVQIHPDTSMISKKVHFDPETLTIKAGEKVRWVNNDMAGHTVTSVDLKNPDNVGTMFNSNLLMPKTTFEVTFKEKGTFGYLCLAHPWGPGKIIVE